MVFMQMSLQTKFQFYAANVPHTKQFFRYTCTGN